MYCLYFLHKRCFLHLEVICHCLSLHLQSKAPLVRSTYLETPTFFGMTSHLIFVSLSSDPSDNLSYCIKGEQTMAHGATSGLPPVFINYPIKKKFNCITANPFIDRSSTAASVL